MAGIPLRYHQSAQICHHCGHRFTPCSYLCPVHDRHHYICEICNVLEGLHDQNHRLYELLVLERGNWWCEA